jgi:hypothetical protein
MILSLDVRRARKGDCLLLHFGTPSEPGLAVIDGGPAGVYGPSLKPRLKAIRAQRPGPPQEPLTVDLMMVSHVDDDHVHGLLELTREETDAQRDGKPRMLQVLSFWHNSFDALLGDTPPELTAAVGAASANGAPSDEGMEAVEAESEEEDLEGVRSGLKVLAGIEQGFRLRQDAEALGYPANPEFDGGLIMAREGGAPVELGGLSLTVVGPLQQELAELHKKHDEWVESQKKQGKSPETALAAYVDRSVANLSSIVVLVEADERRILLTGDARGDKILAGLELVKLVEPGGVLNVDVLKVPHHGSANNLEVDFFRRVVAKHYVFSGNGEHGNPEREALEMLFQARGGEPFTIHLTYDVEEIDAERKKDWEKEQAKQRKRKEKRPGTVVRDDWSHEANSLAAFFEQHPLAEGQEIRIVPRDAPHVIDLLDELGF